MTHDEQKERIREVFGRWRPILGLDEWFIDLSYSDGEFIRGDGEPSKDALAGTDVQWQYRRAQITFNTRRTETASDVDMEYVVIHEAMHVLLNGSRAFRERGDTVGREYETLFEEHTCTTLAWAFLRATGKELSA